MADDIIGPPLPEIISRAEAKAKGLTRFFTGTPCRYGHVTERQVSSAHCLQCSRRNVGAYQKANPDKIRARHDQWAQKNVAKLKEQRLARYRRVAEKKRADKAAYFAANPDKAPPSDAEKKARRAELRAKHRRQNIEKYLVKERARRAAAPHRIKEAQRRYRISENGRINRAARHAANRDKIREQQKALRAADPERHRAYGRKHHAAHPHKARERHRQFKLLHPEKHAAKIAALLERRRRDPEFAAACRRNRQARKKAAGGTHTGEDVRQIYKAQSGKCAYCKAKVGQKYHVDHIQPLAKGGSNDRRNLQILCPQCNLNKNASDPIAYARSLGMLL